MTQEELNFEEGHWRFTKHGAEAWEFIHTPMGGKITCDFIKLALYCRNIAHKTVGQCALWGKIRFEYEYSKPEGHDFKLNNNYLKGVTMFAMERVPELKGYFKTRGDK